MSTQATTQQKADISRAAPASPHRGILQRKCACGGTAGPGGACSQCARKRLKRGGWLQTRLRIGAANDPLEQAADQAADRAMAMPAGSVAAASSPPRVRRQSHPCAADADSAPASVEQVLAGPARGLPDGVRQEMEQRLGFDFSHVRLHVGEAAAQSASDIDARAYAVGAHIVFGRGQFDPGTRNGRWLIAHELAHVAQQTANIRQPDETGQRPSGNAGPVIRRVGECRGRNGYNCNGVSCRTPAGRLGRCVWGGVTYGCNCRDTSGDEPPPYGHRVRIPEWLKWLLGAAATALLIACFASGACEFGAVLGGLSAGTAAVVLSLLRAAGIRDTGSDQSA